MKGLVQFLTETKANTTLLKLVKFLIGDNPVTKEYLQTDDVFFDLAEHLTKGDIDDLAKWIEEHGKDKVSVEYSKNGDLYTMSFNIAGCELSTDVTTRPKF